MRLIALFVIFVLLTGVIMMSIPYDAFAHGPIDQSNIVLVSRGAAISSGLGQGFTSTVNNITGIDIGLKDLCTDEWEVIIHTGDIVGSPVVSVFYTVDATVSLQHIELSLTPLPPGLYVIEVISMDPLSSCVWLGAPDAYAGGFAYFKGSPLLDTDFDFKTYYLNPLDTDGDGFTTDGSGLGLDCDDSDPLVNPDATEIPGNDVDENCDGIVENGDEKKSCEALDNASEKGKGKSKGSEKAKGNNNCS